MTTVTEPLTGATATIVNRARVLGEDWRAPRQPAATDHAPVTIPNRSKTLASYMRGDIVEADGLRWIIRRIDGETVTLVSSNAIAAQITWTTTLTSLPPKGHA